jgi:hypothetical protein
MNQSVSTGESRDDGRNSGDDDVFLGSVRGILQSSCLIVRTIVRGCMVVIKSISELVERDRTAPHENLKQIPFGSIMTAAFRDREA